MPLIFKKNHLNLKVKTLPFTHGTRYSYLLSRFLLSDTLKPLHPHHTITTTPPPRKAPKPIKAAPHPLIFDFLPFLSSHQNTNLATYIMAKEPVVTKFGALLKRLKHPPTFPQLISHSFVIYTLIHLHFHSTYTF